MFQRAKRYQRAWVELLMGGGDVERELLCECVKRLLA